MLVKIGSLVGNDWFVGLFFQCFGNDGGEYPATTNDIQEQQVHKNIKYPD